MNAVTKFAFVLTQLSEERLNELRYIRVDGPIPFYAFGITAALRQMVQDELDIRRWNKAA